VGERNHTNLNFSFHQRSNARQTGLSLGLVFATVVLGRWLLVFARVAFAVEHFGGGDRVFSFSVLVQFLERSSAESAFCHGARGARTKAAADAALSNRERGSGENRGVVHAVHEHKSRARLRRVKLHHAPNAQVGALDDHARSL
jgi:hypothetical protein